MLEVRLIGKFEIKRDGKPVIISSRAAQSLFAYLIITAGTLHRREKLAGMFWPDASEEKARAYLRHELWRIRKSLPKKSKIEYLIATDINISFNASTEYWLDVAALENMVEDPSIEQLIDAVSVFRGEFLPGFYDDWITQEREHVQALYEQRIARLLKLLEEKKRWNDMFQWAEHWIAHGQAPEAGFRYLMVSYAALGDRAKVASTYERCVKALRELDLEPSEQTRALAFKRTTNLNIPIPLTSFIGREKELKEVAELLSKSRLVTLTGSGGVGKTRLAIQVVADVLDRFPDGVWFLDLAPLSDPALVPHTVAKLLGLRESGEKPITEMLINYFHARNALLIFDNCEHLIESCAQLVNSLLISCTDLSVLATSREALRISGEIPYRVPSLELPNPDIDSIFDASLNTESVRLFIERATLASPSFAIHPQNAPVIAKICQRLDGIPLALELAAARTNMLAVEQISKRLDDRFEILTSGFRSALPRHQTLRAMIEWSYNLLSEQESLLFRQLAVFRGGWTLEAAEQVCSGDSIETGEVLDLLSQLVNKSLVPVETAEYETRYGMLETIRQFARKKLIESREEEDICTRHLEYFLHLSALAESGLRGSAQTEWYERLNDDLDNIRAALEWADKADVEAGLYLSGRLQDLWENLDIREGARWLTNFIQKSESNNCPHARAKALLAQGWLLVRFHQFASATSAAQECLELFRACKDKQGEVDGFLLLGAAWSYQDDPAIVLERQQQALVLARSLGDKWRQAKALLNLGTDPGDRQRRFAYWEEALALFREVGDWRELTDLLGLVGFYRVLEGDIEIAQKYLDEETGLQSLTKKTTRRVNAKSAESLIALRRGDYEQARGLLQEMATIDDKLGNRMDYLWDRVRLGYVALGEGNQKEAQRLFAQSAIDFQKDEDPIGITFTLEGVAGLFVAEEQPELAARLIGWADATREKIGDPRPFIEQADVDKIIEACLAKIDEATFLKAYDEGKKMNLDDAVAYAFEKFESG